VAELLTRPSTTVIATVRDPQSDTAVSLPNLPQADGSKLFVVPLDDDNKMRDYSTLSQSLHDNGLDYVDVIIANAGNSGGFKSILETKPENLMADFNVNAVGVLKLFQTCWPCLAKSDAGDIKRKKFVLITSSVGSIAGLEEEGFPSTSYGMSKAAANWLAKKISMEFKTEGLKVGIIHPG
jgi:norsolorinic acid ketoreductase